MSEVNAESAAPAPPGAEFIDSLGRVNASEWDAVAGCDYPFLQHRFLYGLETTACTTADTGW
ncbi:MAG TPA: GNAT family N-acetyltransferase, partial [Halieaceae bacterium]|nr:GNAT family N-acetyltransferase [Halieaceae bacterium]